MQPSRFAVRLDDRIIPLPDGEVEIGRASGCDVRLSGDPSVSRRHAKITFGPEGPSVEDLGSHNGTLVNGQKIGGATRVRHGDRITVGGFVLILQDSSRERFKTPVVRYASVPPPGPADADTETLRQPLDRPGPGQWLRALGIVDPAEREVALAGLLDQLRARIAQGERPEPEVLNIATEALIQLASDRADPKWLEELEGLLYVCRHQPDPRQAHRIAAVAQHLRGG